MSSQMFSTKTSAKTPKKVETRPQTPMQTEQAVRTSKATGRWTRDEHFRFLEALKMYGKEWKKVQQHVCTRSSTQARSHAQKFFVKLEKKNLTMEEFLESLDMTNLKTMIENDSDYGDEGDFGVASVCDDKASQSAFSNNIKSPKTATNNYKRPTFQI